MYNSDLLYDPPNLSLFFTHRVFHSVQPPQVDVFPMCLDFVFIVIPKSYTCRLRIFSQPITIPCIFSGYFWFPGNSRFKLLIFKLSEISAFFLSAWLTSSNSMTLLLHPVYLCCCYLFPTFCLLSCCFLSSLNY